MNVLGLHGEVAPGRAGELGERAGHGQREGLEDVGPPPLRGGPAAEVLQADEQGEALDGGAPGVHSADVPLEGNAFGLVHLSHHQLQLLGGQSVSEVLGVRWVGLNAGQGREVRKPRGHLEEAGDAVRKQAGEAAVPPVPTKQGPPSRAKRPTHRRGSLGVPVRPKGQDRSPWGKASFEGRERIKGGQRGKGFPAPP